MNHQSAAPSAAAFAQEVARRFVPNDPGTLIRESDRAARRLLVHALMHSLPQHDPLVAFLNAWDRTDQAFLRVDPDGMEEELSTLQEAFEKIQQSFQDSADYFRGPY